MQNGPLDDPRLRAVEAALDNGELEEAEELLAGLDDLASHRQGKSYLTTRLLFQRRRLNVDEVAQRMRQVLNSIPYFPQAQALLTEAERGTLSPEPKNSGAPGSGDPGRSPNIPGPPALPAFARTEPELPSPSRIPSADALDLEVVPESENSALGFTEDPKVGMRAEPRQHRRALAPPWAAELGENHEAGALMAALPDKAPEVHEAPEFGSLEPGEHPRITIRADEPGHPYGATDPVPRHQNAARATVDRTLEASRARLAQKPRVTIRAPNPGHPFGATDPVPKGEDPSDGTFEIETEATPTVFSVLTLLDEQRYSEALAALDSSSNRGSPELLLMRARALIGSKQPDEARDLLEFLCEDSRLGPELRAGCARLLLEAGEPELALEQAQKALEVADGSPAVALTTAWALVRVARRDQDLNKRDAAIGLLSRLESAGGPVPALATALWASIWAETGEAERALAAAESALELDAHSVDAVAALATAYTALGHSDEAASAWRKLSSMSAEEALVVRPRLARVEAELERPSPSLVPTSAEPVSRRTWHPLESALLGGERGVMLEAFEASSSQILHSDAKARSGLLELAHDAAQLLSEAPVFGHFGPYDLSLWSVLRLQIAMDLAFGSEPLAHPFRSTEVLLGSYLGEAVRQAYQGSWRGTRESLPDARVQAKASALEPFAQLRNRLEHAVPLTLDDFIPLESANSVYAEWSRRVPISAVPACPWAPKTWPSLEDLGSIGRALGRSIVGLYCERFADQRLDHSLESLPALDSYLTLIAPANAPRVEPSPSLTRVALLAGAYVGEVLKLSMGAEWQPGVGGTVQAYVLDLGGLSLRPVQQLLERVTGETDTSVTEYVTRIGSQIGY